MARAEIIPVFIPHGGCPHRCVFCDQRTISGQTQKPSLSSVAALFDGEHRHRELAYYGGSFTAIERSEMLAYLQLAQTLKREGRIGAIRLSTHPHYVDDEIIKILQDYDVDTVELGVQSTNDAVLRRCRRGCTRLEIMEALRLLRRGGFTVGAQLMTGLPGATRDDEMATARDMVAADPDIIRIYPTLVLRGTALAAMTAAGKYQSAALADTVYLVRDMLAVFLYHKLRVIRMGLQRTDVICRGSEALIGGPYHESFGYLVQSALKYEQLRLACQEVPFGLALAITCPPRELPLIYGDHGGNVAALREKWQISVAGDENLSAGDIAVNGRLLSQRDFLKNYLKHENLE